MGEGNHGGPRPGSGRPRSGRDDIAVKMDRAVVARARYVAEMRGVSLAEYLSEVSPGPSSTATSARG